ncbi:Topless-related protein 4 [Camellia lanceoleosa]|nr:Topless-related protein 4 [Camellia lanceoleosa]
MSSFIVELHCRSISATLKTSIARTQSIFSFNPNRSLCRLVSESIVTSFLNRSEFFGFNPKIDAHTGNVSDLAFFHPNKQLCVITCGEDKTIKVWDVATGSKQYTFEGHQLPIYSVCPHTKENIKFIFSTGIDGKIKAWLYDNLGSRADYDAPGHSCTTMAYSADGTRLFSCGTSNEGESYIVEWNESEGAVKRTYHGLGKRSVGVVQFDTTKNRFLAAGDEFVIKFWNMDNVNLLTTTDAEGGLPVIIGLQYGHILEQLQDHKERLYNWYIFSFSFLGIGLFLTLVGIPLNKPLYTISYMLVTSASAGITFSALYILVDIHGHRHLTYALEWIGKYAQYFCSHKF